MNYTLKSFTALKNNRMVESNKDYIFIISLSLVLIKSCNGCLFRLLNPSGLAMRFLPLPMLETGTILSKDLTSVILSSSATKLYGVTLLDDNFLSMKE